MSEWNLNQLRKIAGLNENAAKPAEVLNERWSDDDSYDDEDPDVKIASGDKRQAAFEKRNRKDIKSADKAADKKDAEKKAAKPAEKEVKKDEPEKKAPAEGAAEAKRRGKAPNENSFNQQAKKYAQEHTRGSFIKWAAENHGKGKNYASALFAKYNPKSGREKAVTEAPVVWGISHPFLQNFVLAENRELNQMQWVDSSSPLDSVIFTTEEAANKVAKYMAEWKNQTVNVERFDFSDDE